MGALNGRMEGSECLPGIAAVLLGPGVEQIAPLENHFNRLVLELENLAMSTSANQFV